MVLVFEESISSPPIFIGIWISLEKRLSYAAVTAKRSGVFDPYDFTGSLIGVGDFKKLFDMIF
jgi:hypothetical protein